MRGLMCRPARLPQAQGMELIYPDGMAAHAVAKVMLGKLKGLWTAFALKLGAEMASQFEDLDELILRCRNEKARLYIGEAVASYRAGAFRASIVSCWVAVCFDVMEKLRDLALAGVPDAESQVRELDLTRRAGDMPRALKFEREILALARDKFQLISHLEFTDLERLQMDRNRCAHPSLTSDDQAYAPPAELARLHIHSAVVHLLQHPPVQGKEALDRLKRDVDSVYFPTTEEGARVAFSSGPLKRPRESLVRNFVLVLVKAILKANQDYQRRKRLAAALAAVLTMHPAVATTTLRQALPIQFRALLDDSLDSAITFLEEVKDTWQYLEADIILRLQNYVESLPADALESLEFLLKFEPLKDQALKRTRSATATEIAGAFFLELPSELVDRLLQLYLDSPSFDAANNRAKQIVSHSYDFRPEQVRRLLTSMGDKPQITGSYQIRNVISDLRSTQKIPPDEFEALLSENNLGEYSLKE